MPEEITRSQRHGWLQLFADPAADAAPPPAADPAPAAAAADPAASADPAAAQPDARVEQAFAKRLSQERTKIEAEIRKQHEHDIRLGEVLRKQGYEPSAVLSQWEQQQMAAQAQQAGMSPAVYAELQALKQEREGIQRDRTLATLQTEATALKTEFGAVFEQHAQAAIDRAAQTGESLEESFFAVGRRDILKAQQAQAEQKVLAQVTGRESKGPVNATGGPQVTPENDVSKMPKDQFEKLKREVMRGDRRSL